MQVLVLGSGAREHALALSLSRDPAVSALMCAPGNPGTAAIARNYAVTVNDAAAVAALTREVAADLVIIGPEGPLVAGVADAVRAVGVPCFGPSAAAARVEGSKAFAKEVMAAAGIPTAAATACTGLQEVSGALDAYGAPYVVKDDGLAGGKGVVVTSDRSAAAAHAAACGSVVVEEHLDGPEASVFAVTDGVDVVPLQPAQDFKRAWDGDEGPNTGGMGAYAPLPRAEPGLADSVAATIIQPAVSELRRRGTPYVGLLYAGLALTAAGPKVVEFNARFGDPETQALLMTLRSSLGELLYAAATGTLADAARPDWHEGGAVTVVMAAEGYPSAAVTGDVVGGIPEAESVPGTRVLHAGTTYDERGRLVTSGGRVLSVTSSGASVEEARARAYEATRRVQFRGAHYRRDIAAGVYAAA